MAEKDELLQAIETFLAETGMGPTTFGVKAVNNAHLVGRLRQGRDIEMATWTKVRAFLDRHRSVEAAE